MRILFLGGMRGGLVGGDITSMVFDVYREGLEGRVGDFGAKGACLTIETNIRPYVPWPTGTCSLASSICRTPSMQLFDSVHCVLEVFIFLWTSMKPHHTPNIPPPPYPKTASKSARREETQRSKHPDTRKKRTTRSDSHPYPLRDGYMYIIHETTNVQEAQN